MEEEQKKGGGGGWLSRSAQRSWPSNIVIIRNLASLSAPVLWLSPRDWNLLAVFFPTTYSLLLPQSPYLPRARRFKMPFLGMDRPFSLSHVSIDDAPYTLLRADGRRELDSVGNETSYGFRSEGTQLQAIS